MKRCSTSLAVREMQIKTIIRYYILTGMAIINNSKCWQGCGGSEIFAVADMTISVAHWNTV